jgi:hypothetical protein
MPPDLPKHGLISTLGSAAALAKFGKDVKNIGLERFIAAAKFAARSSAWASACEGEPISLADAAMKHQCGCFVL